MKIQTSFLSTTYCFACIGGDTTRDDDGRLMNQTKVMLWKYQLVQNDVVPSYLLRYTSD
jgi:hypothetical protein